MGQFRDPVGYLAVEGGEGGVLGGGGGRGGGGGGGRGEGEEGVKRRQGLD